MEESIIIYTKYYSEAVIELLDRYDLNIQLLCYSSYNKVIEKIKTVPNLRGVIFLEYKPSGNSFKAYEKIFTILNEIGAETDVTPCVSIISNNDTVRKFVNEIRTEHINIFFTKYLIFNTDLLRFEGVSVVIANSIGIDRNTAIEEIDSSNYGSVYNSNVDFYRYAITLVTSPLNSIDSMESVLSRYPTLKPLHDIRKGVIDGKDAYSKAEGIFKLFIKQAIDRSVIDEKEKDFRYY